MHRLLAAFLFSTTCTSAPTTVDGSKSAPPGESQSGAAQDAGDGAEGGVVEQPGASKETPCNTDAECNGGTCEGEGCGDMQGRCEPKDRMCTRDLQAYCGCDGQTFRSSGSCPGRRFAHRGECSAALPDGSKCTNGTQCASGICEGEGCGDDQPGACMARDRQCTLDLRQYCGCDGQTFQGSGSCPGGRFAKRGKC